MSLPQTVATHYHAQLHALPDKGRAIIGLVICYVVSRISVIGLWTSSRCVVWSLVGVRMANELKYRNTPSIHADRYISHKWT